MEAPAAILIGAALATAGWIYTARRSRTLARKQHTINVMMQTNFSAQFVEARSKITPHVRNGACPDAVIGGEDEELIKAFRMVLNHYEFVAAGLRNGDFDERLVRDSERGTYVTLFRSCENYVWHLRNDRSRMSIYEHLEWLYIRWEEKPPGKLQRFCEWIAGRPVPGRRARRS